MNLSEALDAALPDIPQSRLTRVRPPCLDPDLIVKDDILDGEPIVGVMQRGKCNYYRFPPDQWQLALLFDGVRSYEEIAVLFTENTGMDITPAMVRTFAQNMDESEFWYQSPQEKNVALSEKLLAQRSRRAGRKSKVNLAHISFSAWDPDQYLGWLDRTIGRFIYNPWSVTILVALVVFQGLVYISGWKILGPDIILYYTFTHKSLYDLAEFWILFLMLGFLHETAHGLTCKHFGGQVHSMGLMFLYLTPCFFVDVTEGWVSATRVQRLATIIAGIWVEMTLCSLAMIVWLNTLPGQWLHDFAYEIILLTGIALILINLNPLIKLDGYYFLTECIGLPDLKERSTAFLSGWFQGRVLGLPVEVPVIPKRRLPLFTLYAFTSGLYSYLLLFAVIRLTYNIFSNWLAEFALIPAGALAFGVFRSRLRSLRSVIQRFYAHHFAVGFRWRLRHFVAAVVVLILVFVPFLRDREDAMFVIEPAQSAVVHASAPGKIQQVFVREGQKVAFGQPLLQIASPGVAALRSSAAAQTDAARYQAFSAEIQRRTVGTAVASRQAAAQTTRLADVAQSSLILRAPEDARVLTADPASLLNQYVAIGQPLLSLAASGGQVARIFIPASGLDRITPNAEVALVVPGRFSIVRLHLTQMEGEAVALPPGLVAAQEYKGIVLPTFYCARVPLPAQADMALGTGGHAKIFGSRRSIAQRFITALLNLVHAHIW
jgi:putative peptide zinc metalloprotease protein